MPNFDEELQKIKLEQARFELEEMKERAAKRKMAQEDRLRLQKQLAQDQMFQERKLAAERKWCKHRKGGKDRNGIQNGSDTNYSIVQHTYTLGDIRVMCTRCLAEWKQGDTSANHPTGISYEEAMRFPTDNSPSGSVTFSFV